MIAEIVRIKQLVADGHIREAIKEFSQVLSISNSDLHNDVLLLAARYSKLKSSSRKGILSKEQQDLEYARIVNALLEISEEVTEDEGSVQGFVDLKTHLEDAAKKFDVTLTEGLQRAVIRRIVFVKEMELALRVLWVDDKPHFIRDEQAVLEIMPLQLDLAKSTAEARQLLAENEEYDLILSDVGRDGNWGAGFAFAQELLDDNSAIPFVFYTIQTGRPMAPPANTFGIAFRPNELFHLVLDVMVRKG
jgi:CheY-like chemotaxis protein